MIMKYNDDILQRSRSVLRDVPYVTDCLDVWLSGNLSLEKSITPLTGDPVNDNSKEGLARSVLVLCLIGFLE